jgi:hypothetical protein
VAQLELFEKKDLPAAPRQTPSGSCSHDATAEHRYVDGFQYITSLVQVLRLAPGLHAGD